MNNRFRELRPESGGSLVSEQLGLRLVPEGTMLRLIDLATNQPILTRREQTDAARRETDEALRRIDELAAELARLREQQSPPSRRPRRR